MGRPIIYRVAMYLKKIVFEQPLLIDYKLKTLFYWLVICVLWSVYRGCSQRLELRGIGLEFEGEFEKKFIVIAI